MLEYLFGSKTRLKLFRLFFGHPEKKFFVRELSRLIGVQINSVRRELGHLQAAGVIVLEAESSKEEKSAKASLAERESRRAKKGRYKFYLLNPDGIINAELHSLLLKDQIWGERQLMEAIKKLGAVDYLFLGGRFTRENDSPTDLLVVGNTPRKDLNRLIQLFEKTFDCEVRYTVMTLKEFLYRRDVADKFLSDFLGKTYLTAVDKSR